jgi:hypothetical protein
MSLQKQTVIFDPVCHHCHQHFIPGTLCWAVGQPYHILLHGNCAPYYDYNKGYPHKEPYQYYLEKSREVCKEVTKYYQ